MEQLAQLGMGIFALFIAYLIVKEIVSFRKKGENGNDLKEVVKNNTRAMEALTTCVHDIKESQIRVDQKLDELLRR